MAAVFFGTTGRLLVLLTPKRKQGTAGAATGRMLPASAESTEEAPGNKALSEADGPSAVAALRDLQTPFFATSFRWKTDPRFGLEIPGNLRLGAEDRWLSEAAPVVAARLEAALGRPLSVHLLRDSEEESRESTSRLVGGSSVTYHLWVTSRSSDSDAQSFTRGLAASFASLAACVACAAYGAIGVDATSLLAAALFLVGIVARAAVGQSLGESLAPPLFLPSPQFGILGSLQQPLSPIASRSAAVAIALSGPLALGLCSALLMLYGAAAGSGVAAAVPPELQSAAWLVQSLGPSCDAASLAGAHGLLAASLMLLPQSPDGYTVLRCLVGRSNADWISEAATFLYPLFGLVSVYFLGGSWSTLPFWWAFLLINLPQRQPGPTLEEVTEVSPALRGVAVAAMVSAVYCTEPWLLSW